MTDRLMATQTSTKQQTQQSVSMAEIAVATSPGCLQAVLGSCVGVILYDKSTKVGVLGHIVLPDSCGRSAVPGKFVDTAIPRMLALLAERGISSRQLVAKMAGGASMFNHRGPMQIGDANVVAIRDALAAAGIRLVAEDVGGNYGRRIRFSCETGKLVVETVGNSARRL